MGGAGHREREGRGPVGEGEGTVLELEDLDGSVPARVWLEKDERQS